jgi:hypothetical protein
VKLLTVSYLAKGPTSLAECPSNTDVVYLHLNRAHYNSMESPSNLAESLSTYNSNTESPGYRLNPAERPTVSPECPLNYNLSQ